MRAAPAALALSLLAAQAAAQEAPRPLARPTPSWGPASQRTSVEARARSVSAEAGYLCGLDGGGDDRTHGPLSSFGRPGTFLGARVGLAFR